MGIGATAKGPEIDPDPVPVRTQPRLETAAARPCAFAKSRPRLPIPRRVHLRGPRRNRSPHPREHARVDAIGQRMDQPSEDDPLRISPSIWLGMASTFSSGSIESYSVYRGGTLRVTFTATQLSYRDTASRLPTLAAPPPMLVLSNPSVWAASGCVGSRSRSGSSSELGGGCFPVPGH